MNDPSYVPATWLRELTGLSDRRLREWHKVGVLRSHATDTGTAPSLYTFRDAVGLRLLALLKDRVPLDELRTIQPWLERNVDVPWERLRVRLRGNRLMLEDEANRTVDDRPNELTVNVGEVARELRVELARQGERGPDQIGRLERRRGVMGGAVVIAGTRIPPSAVWSFHEAGYGTEAIIEQYPSLKPEDVEAAIAYERERREQRARRHRAA